MTLLGNFCAIIFFISFFGFWVIAWLSWHVCRLEFDRRIRAARFFRRFWVIHWWGVWWENIIVRGRGYGKSWSDAFLVFGFPLAVFLLLVAFFIVLFGHAVCH